jgi:hypothetical protein
MKSELLPEDYLHFEKTWYEVQTGSEAVFPVHPEVQICVAKELFIFHIYMVELLHLDRLIYVAYYEPKDDGKGNRERCEAYFLKYNPAEKSCIHAWDF